MPETRMFYAIYGVVGQPDTHKRSQDGEMWTVRRVARAVAKEAAKSFSANAREEDAEVYEAVAIRFLEGQVGELMFGLTIEVDVDPTAVRFIAVCPAGKELAENQSVQQFHKGMNPTKIRGTVPVSNLPSLASLRGSEPRWESPAKPKEPSKAERIAAKMAKATKDAVDNA